MPKAGKISGFNSRKRYITKLEYINTLLCFLLVNIPKLHESINLTGYVTFIMASKMEVEFIKSCLQEVVFFKFSTAANQI